MTLKVVPADGNAMVNTMAELPSMKETFGYTNSIPTVETHVRDSLSLPLSSAADEYLRQTLERIDTDLREEKVDLKMRLSSQMGALDNLTRDLNIKLLDRGESSPTHYKTAGQGSYEYQKAAKAHVVSENAEPEEDDML